MPRKQHTKNRPQLSEIDGLKHKLLSDVTQLEPVLETVLRLNDTTVSYGCRGLVGFPLGNHMKVYSVAIQDELCFFSALALLTRKAQLGNGLPSADEVLAIAVSQATSVNDVRGHSLEYIQQTCDRLKLACITFEELREYHMGGSNLALKMRGTTPCLPAIVTIKQGEIGHVVLALPSGKKHQPFSYSQLAQALTPDQDVNFVPRIYTNSAEVMFKKRQNKEAKKVQAPTEMSEKESSHRRLVRKYEQYLATLEDVDLPEKEDLTLYYNFCELYSALIEIREKRATTFKFKTNTLLLQQQPMPQNRRQLYLARSLVKKHRLEYVAMEEAVEVNPLVNKDQCYAGKDKEEKKEDEPSTACLELTIDQGFWSINQTYTINTDLEAGVNRTVDDATFLSWYTTPTPNVVTGEKAGIAPAVEVTSDRSGNISMRPACQTQLPNNVKQQMIKFHGAQMLDRSHLRAPGCGGHPIQEYKRTCTQCSLDERLLSAALTQIHRCSTIHVEIGSKFASVANKTHRAISAYASTYTKGHDPNDPQKVIKDFRGLAAPHPVQNHRVDICLREWMPQQIQSTTRKYCHYIKTVLGNNQMPEWRDLFTIHVRPQGQTGNSHDEGSYQVQSQQISLGLYDTNYYAENTARMDDFDNLVYAGTIQDFHRHFQTFWVLAGDIRMACKKAYQEIDVIDSNEHKVRQYWLAKFVFGQPPLIDPNVVRWFEGRRIAILDQLLNDLQTMSQIYAAYVTTPECPQPFKDFYPHLQRILDMQEDLYTVKFAAKDTAYYWGNDPRAISDPTPEIVQNYKPEQHDQTGLDIHHSITHAQFYASGAMIYAQGSVFPTIPGRYPLPHNEGHYIITSAQKVIMYTNKNGSPYIHDNLQPQQEIWSGQTKMDWGYAVEYLIVTPLKEFKWYKPTDYESLRAENHRVENRIWNGEDAFKLNTRPGTPCEATSTLDFDILNLLTVYEKSLGKTGVPISHTTFAVQLRKRIKDAAIEREHYTQKAIELALRKIKIENVWAIFRDYSELDPHSKCAAEIKTAIAELAEENAFNGLAGKRVKITVFAGLRKFTPFLSSQPIYEASLTISTTAAQSTICVRPDVYCGKNKDPATKMNDSHFGKRNTGPSIDNADDPYQLIQIAARVDALNVQVNAQQIVEKVLSMTGNARTANTLVSDAVKRSWLALPKVSVVPTDVDMELSSNYFWSKKVDSKEIDTINPLLLVLGKEEVTRRTLHYLRRLYETLEVPTTLYKNKLIPRDFNSTTKFYQVLAGAQVCDKETGERVYNHEYAHNSFDNLVGAVCTRQFGTMVQPCKAHVSKFRLMVGNWMDTWVPQLIDEWLPTKAFDYIDGQDSFSRDKKLKYVLGQTRFLIDPTHNNCVGHFQPIVKSGEVYEHTLEQGETEDGFHNKTKCRPRLVCPGTASCTGVMAAFQSTLFGPLKTVLPEFIHSATSADIIENVSKRIRSDFKAISIDGSGFDSSQFAELQEAVDNEFFIRIQPLVEKWCYYQCEGLQNTRDPQKLTSVLMDSLLQTIYTLYVQAPGIDDDEWTADQHSEYRRETNDRQDRPWENIARLEINGTTFSGLSTRTTLGNTLRSIAYMYYDIQEAGIPEPWLSEDICVIAAGDDTVCWCDPSLTKRIVKSITELTARDKKYQVVGLGQVVTQIDVGEFWEVEFCSKKSSTLDGTLGTWKMYRNLRKVLTKKQYTNSRNLTFLYRPEVYLGALLYSLRLEKLSSLVECIRSASLNKLTGGRELDEQLLYNASKKHVYTLNHNSSADYQMEELINAELGITTETLYRLAGDNKIYAGNEKSLTKERQAKYDAAKQKMYRHCKHSEANDRFKPEPHVPLTRDEYMDNSHITVTTNINVALDFFSGYQPQLNCVVDNEADLGYTNALIISIPHTRRVLLFHGPTVHYEQFHVYERLEKLGATCHSWGTQLEADYPNLVDIQSRHALLNQTPMYQGIGLTNAARKLGLQEKVANDDYAAYTKNVIDRLSVNYAVRDVTLPEIIRHTFAPTEGYTTVVRCAQMDYKLPPHIARDWPKEHLNVTWCKLPQVHTYARLQDMISESCQQDMTIVDFGASPDLSSYSRTGSSCVAQSIAFGSIPYLRPAKNKTYMNILRDPSKFQSLYSDIGVPLGAIMKNVLKQGAALDKITAMLNEPGSNDTLSVAIWTPSTLDARLNSGNTTKGKAQINLVIQNYHSMIAVPSQLLANIPRERYILPSDCPEQCWKQYPGSLAHRLHLQAFSVNTCNSGYVYASDLLLSAITGTKSSTRMSGPVPTVQNDWIRGHQPKCFKTTASALGSTPQANSA